MMHPAQARDSLVAARLSECVHSDRRLAGLPRSVFEAGLVAIRASGRRRCSRIAGLALSSSWKNRLLPAAVAAAIGSATGSRTLQLSSPRTTRHAWWQRVGWRNICRTRSADYRLPDPCRLYARAYSWCRLSELESVRGVCWWCSFRAAARELLASTSP